MRPSAQPCALSSQLVKKQLEEIENETLFSDNGEEEDILDDVQPRLNVPFNQTIAKDLPKLKVDDMPAPKKIYKKPSNLKPRNVAPTKVDIEYNYVYHPVKLDPPHFEIPADFGKEYMNDQMIDLIYQFCRLTTPEISP